MDHAGRARRVRQAVTTAGCDALVVTHLTNIRYLTGFTGSAGVLVVGPDDMLLVTDGRYEEQAADELAASGAGADLAVERSVDAQRRAIAGRLGGAGAVGLEADHISWAEQRRYGEWLEGTRLVPTSELVESGRSVKDDGEVARIEAACAMADAALAATLHLLGSGPTEVAFARALDEEVRAQGAADVSFETIVASGPNGSRPHHRPSERPIANGDLVVIDFGALVDGYHSDMTRTIAVGGAGALHPTQAQMLEVVGAAQAAGVATVGPGVDAREVDAACRQVIAEAGWDDAFVHGTGHGVGLDIHEAPGVWATSAATLTAGHVVTVEPGVYLPGHGGVRIEDTVLVTPTGCRPLTGAPKSQLP